MRRDDDPFYTHPDAFPFNVWRAWGRRANDGDTLVAGVETGRNQCTEMEFRLSTIDCYELHSGPAEWRKLAEQARLFTESKIAKQPLRVISVMDTEKYGRTLTVIRYQNIGTAGPWFDLADALRKAGFEKPHALTADRAVELARDRMILSNLLRMWGL